MMADDVRGTGPEVTELLRASGLELSDRDTDAVASLYARYATDRARLATLPLGETEPAVVFVAEPASERQA